jgi:hypothetical protein
VGSILEMIRIEANAMNAVLMKLSIDIITLPG